MARLTLSLLGPFDLHMNGKPVPGFEANRVQALLAYLAVEQDHAHRREALGELLWPERSKDAVHNNLRKALFRLRQTIGDDAASPPHLLATQKTIQWNAASDHWIDTGEFQSLIAIAKGHPHPQQESCDTCIGLLRQAAALYRGDFLADLYLEDSAEFENWTLVKREMLRHQMLEALAALSASHEKRADYRQAIEYARRRTALDPLSEEAHRHLMALLALAGQRTEALAQYKICCGILAEEVGVEPSDETTELHERIQSGDLQRSKEHPLLLHVDVVQEAPPHNLPAQLTPFVGREQELAQVLQRLQSTSSRLITIVGIGGIGKTRLALAAGDKIMGQFPQGVWFVSLAGVSVNSSSEANQNTLAAMLGQALGFDFSSGSQPAEQIISYLRHQQALLILDNFEYLTSGTSYLAEILQKAPRIKILVTSRERLHLQAEYAIQLDGLPVPLPGADGAEDAASIRLFAERAEHASSSYREAECGLPYVVEICHLVQGIPLAIELAAAWIGHLTCIQIVQAIRHDLEFLTTTMRDVPVRQRSLRAVFEHSWGLLTQVERAALSKLSVFRGGFTLEAAEHVADASFQILADLQDKSLVKRDGVLGRYEMHELVRLFAHDKLVELGDLDSAKARHFEFFLRLFEEAAPKMRTAERQATLKRLAEDYDNFGAALQWSDATEDREGDTLRLAGAVDWWLWQHWGDFQAGRYWLEKALHGPNTPTESNVRAKALFSAAALAFYQGQLEPGCMMVQQAVALYTASSNQAGLAQALGGLGIILMMQNKYDEALFTLKQAEDFARSAGDLWLLALTLGNTGDAFAASQDYTSAYPYYGQALHIARQVGDPWLITLPLYGMASVMMGQHNYRAAHGLFEESLAIQRDIGDKWIMARTLLRLGDVALCQGDHSQAKAYYTESLEVWRGLGNSEHVIILLGNLATLAQWQNDYRLAAKLLHECVALRWELWFREGMVRFMIGLAGMALFTRRPEQAAYFLGASEKYTGRVDHYTSPADRVEYERVKQDVHAYLDDRQLANAWEAGLAMSDEQALQSALSEAAGAWDLLESSH